VPVEREGRERETGGRGRGKGGREIVGEGGEVRSIVADLKYTLQGTIHEVGMCLSPKTIFPFKEYTIYF
jgi:hypothetical protein